MKTIYVNSLDEVNEDWDIINLNGIEYVLCINCRGLCYFDKSKHYACAYVKDLE